MKRSVWKLPYVSPTFFQKRFLKKSLINIFLRGSCIPARFVNNKIGVYNGKYFVFLVIKRKMVGKKFGEFSITKKIGSGHFARFVRRLRRRLKIRQKKKK